MRMRAWVGVVAMSLVTACGGGAPAEMTEGGTGETAAPASGSGTAAAPATAPAPVRITLPEGTVVPIRLAAGVSTESAQVGDAVRGTVATAVSVDGRVVVPEGAEVTGAVTEATRPGRVKGRAALAVRFSTLNLAGTEYALAATPVAREGQATKGEDAKKVGIAAGAGAALGAILGGGDGAAKGAAVGAAGGTGVVLATRGEDVGLAAGEAVEVTLTAPLPVTLR